MYYLRECILNGLKILNVIDKEDLPHLYVAGGAVLSTYLGDYSHRDYDLYFDDSDLANKYSEKLANSNWNKSRFSYHDHATKISLNLDFSGPPHVVLDSFDFHHCRLSTYIVDHNLSLLDTNYINIYNYTKECILKKQIKVHRITHPTITLMRTIKYIQRGWTIDNDTWKIICLAASSDDADVAMEFIKYPLS